MMTGMMASFVIPMIAVVAFKDAPMAAATLPTPMAGTNLAAAAPTTATVPNVMTNF